MKNRIRVLLLIVILLSVTFFAVSCKADSSDPILNDRFDLTNRVLDFIKNNYYDEIDYDMRDLYATYGLVSGLGKYNYINPISSFFGGSSDGKGFGLIVRNTKYNEHLIETILPGSPFLAASNGRTALRGDEIYAVNGNRLSGLDTSAYSSAISALPSDEEVIFTLKRGEEKFDVSYSKIDFDFPYCIYIDHLNGVPEDFGYISIRTFEATEDQKVETEFAAAVRSFNQDGNKALILDLRGNGGGSGEVFRKVASALIGAYQKDDTLLEIHYVKEDVYESISSVEVADRIDTDIVSIYVLCDGQTASASEALIGTMKAHGTLTALIGQKTVGKGVAQNGFSPYGITSSKGYVVDKALDKEGNEIDFGYYLVQVVIGEYYIYDKSAEGGKYCMHGKPFVPDISVTEDTVVSPDYSLDPYIRAAIESFEANK